jgi:glucuronosyltransferase
MPEPAQPLPADLAAWVEGSGPLGTVFVSFGGTLEAPAAASRTLVRIMQSMPDVRFVWKLRREQQAEIASEIAGLSNTRISEWVPQNDLLGHPKVRAFVTQGGYLSMAEAAYHAVPVLGLPFIPGQGEQIMFAQDQGRAKRIPADTLMKGDAEGFKAALMDILTHDSYKAAADVISKRLRAVARPYKQVAADYVEYAAAVKDHGPFLNPHKLHQYWYQQVMLDVVLFFAAVLAVPVLLLWRWVHRVRLSYASKGPSSRSSMAAQAAVVAQVTLAAASPGKKAV